MPNRILKETICTSDTLDKLNSFQENVFYRLIVNCDDFGRMDARPRILATRLYPLKDIRAEQIENALQALSSAGLVIVYEVDGKPFVQMKTWERHQQIRNQKSKYPGPDGSYTAKNSKKNQLKSIEINCNQLKSDEINCPRNPIQSSPVVVVTRAREDDGDDELTENAERLDQVFEAAASIGLSKGMDLEKANLLAADYSAEWVLEAIRRASNGPKDAWCWRYIEGILRSWKKAGGIDAKGKTEKRKTITEKIVVGGEIVDWTHEVPV